MRQLGRLGFALRLFALLLPALGQAAVCPPKAATTAELTAPSAASRLSFLRDSLALSAERERRFMLGWSLTYVGLGAGGWVLLPLSSDPNQKVDAIYSSASSLFGALVVLIEPLRAIGAHRQLEALVHQAAAQPAAASGECRLVSEAERLLGRVAASEVNARGPLAHIGGLLFNVGLGLGLAYGLHRPDSAAINTTVGILIGEVMIATRPTVAIQRLDRYRAGDFSRSPPPPVLTSLFALPRRLGDGYGLAIGSRF